MQSIPGDFSTRHYTIQNGEIVFEEPDVEYQHYIIAGCALFGGRIIHSESAIFIPGNQKFDEPRKHRFMHMGESELRILTARARASNLMLAHISKVPVPKGCIVPFGQKEL
jgi:hypothetical protein